MRNSLAAGLARGFYQDDPGRQDSEKGRLAGIFATDQGRELLFGGGKDGGIPAPARKQALDVICKNRSIAADTLRDTAAPPSTNPAPV